MSLLVRHFLARALVVARTLVHFRSRAAVLSLALLALTVVLLNILDNCFAGWRDRRRFSICRRPLQGARSLLGADLLLNILEGHASGR